MENSNINFSLDKLIIIKLMTFQKNPKKIEENSEILYKITIEYLKQAGINQNFLDKPAVIERVKCIIFNNLILKENTKILPKSIIYNDETNEIIQNFGILKNGSVVFYNKNKKQTKAFCIEELDDDITCRFVEYYQDGGLKSEKRVIIDEYGFDKKTFEIFNENNKYSINEQFREIFNPIIDNAIESELRIFSDWGNASMTPNLDYEFLCDKTKKFRNEERLGENKVDEILFNEDEEIFMAYTNNTQGYFERLEYDVKKIKENYKYYVSKYPNAKKWFIDRYGIKFLEHTKIENNFDDINEISNLQRIQKANLEEVLTNYKNIDISKEEIQLYIETLYNEKNYEKALAIFKKFNNEEKLEFIKSKKDYDLGFISSSISTLENDEIKKEILESEEYEFDIWNKVAIISSLKNEEDKVKLYNKYLDEILQQDENLLEDIEDEEKEISKYEYVSEVVLNSLKEPENIEEFIYKFEKFPIIRANNLKDFSKEKINELLKELEENLDYEELIAFFDTGIVEDDNIIYILEKNWEDILDFSENYDLECIEYSFKTYSLLSIEDEEKRLEFLDNYINDFETDEIIIILDEIEDEEKRKELIEKYDILKDFENEKDIQENEYTNYLDDGEIEL